MNVIREEENFAKLALAGVTEEAAVQLPSASTLGRSVKKWWKHHGDIPPIPPEYRQTYDGHPSLKFDSADQNCRILIYATDMNLIFLKNSEHWFCDGTFKVTTYLFYCSPNKTQQTL